MVMKATSITPDEGGKSESIRVVTSNWLQSDPRPPAQTFN